MLYHCLRLYAIYLYTKTSLSCHCRCRISKQVVDTKDAKQAVKEDSVTPQNYTVVEELPGAERC